MVEVLTKSDATKEEKIRMTQEDYDKFLDELKNLEVTLKSHCPQEIDSREDRLTNQSSLIYSIVQLRFKLDNAEIIRNDDISDYIVAIGKKIIIKVNGERETLELVSTYDGKKLGQQVSINSYFGKELIGKKLGETFVCDLGTIEIESVYKESKEETVKESTKLLAARQ